MSATRSPTCRSMVPSSAGVTNRRQSWVPTGSQRSRYSAPTLAARNDCGVRLRVERNSLPPGVSRAARVRQERRRVGHVLDHLQRRDDREPRPLGQQVLGDAGAVGERQVRPAAWARAASIASPAASIPSTSKPSARSPAPRRQPSGAAADIRGEGRTRPPAPLPRGAGEASWSASRDPGHPRRVHPVQRPHRPVRVPPSRRQRVEPCNLLRAKPSCPVMVAPAVAAPV